MLSRRTNLILEVLIATLAVLFLFFSALGLYLLALSQDLPDLDVDPSALGTARTSIVYAADGSVLTEWHAEQDRRIVPYDEIPPHLRDAVIAVEDERFYRHHGVDFEAIMRALRANAQEGAVAQGGSTITQQLVKLLFTTGERTIARKLREALLANQLETKADKRKVLETYLNLVYFGQGSYGVESASRKYFGKPANDLDLPESATLAGIIQSPSRYSPVQQKEAARKRRDVVLVKMREQGYITPEQEREAKRKQLAVQPPKDVAPVAPFFVEYVKQDLIARLGAEKVFEGGLRVHTSLEPALQAHAEKVARSVLGGPKDPEVALVSVDHQTGRVKAMVGGRDFRKDQFNLAAQGKRQPGSAFKLFVLVTALQEGVSPDQAFPATPYEVRVKDGVWKVQNYENSKTSSSMTLSAATAWSVNAVYARLIMKVGPKDVVRTAQKMGITSPLNADPAIALGGLKHGVTPLEMASAYGTIANRGMRVPTTGIVKVTDDRGRLVYEPKPKPERVVPEEVASTTNDLLHGVVTGGTGTAANLPQYAAGKTGTTQSYRDAWFVGYSGPYSTAVWVGYAKGQIDMTNVHGIKVTGGSFPAQIWRAYMQRAVLQKAPPKKAAGSAPPAIDGDVHVVCLETFLLANDRCPNTTEIYLPKGEEPKAVCEVHR